ncbi:MAG TPA: hypothetical protein VKB09_13635 [Thermomicrobiales bacterium]|nr:hypothetical protein [Thermomicrobiales bacterium]
MSSLPPESPPPRKRRTWLWILLGVIAAIILCCCALSVWASTGSGEQWFERKGTQFADYMTEQAGP